MEQYLKLWLIMEKIISKWISFAVKDFNTPLLTAIKSSHQGPSEGINSVYFL